MKDTPTVLFVDDDDSLLKALHMRYSATYSVLTAGTPEDAVDLVREREDEIDVVVVDRWMAPRGATAIDEDAGLRVIQALKGVDGQPGYAPQLPVIVLTGHADNQSHFDALKAGAFTYIVKGTTGWEQDLDEQIKMAGTISINVRLGKLARRLLGLRGTKAAAEGEHAEQAHASQEPNVADLLRTIVQAAEAALAQIERH